MEIDVARLLRLPVAERIRLAERLWGSIGDDAGADVLPLTPAQRAEIDRRLAEDDSDPDDGLPVDQAMAELRRQIWPGG